MLNDARAEPTRTEASGQTWATDGIERLHPPGWYPVKPCRQEVRDGDTAARRDDQPDVPMYTEPWLARIRGGLRPGGLPRARCPGHPLVGSAARECPGLPRKPSRRRDDPTMAASAIRSSSTPPLLETSRIRSFSVCAPAKRNNVWGGAVGDFPNRPSVDADRDYVSGTACKATARSAWGGERDRSIDRHRKFRLSRNGGYSRCLAHGRDVVAVDRKPVRFGCRQRESRHCRVDILTDEIVLRVGPSHSSRGTVTRGRTVMATRPGQHDRNRPAAASAHWQGRDAGLLRRGLWKRRRHHSRDTAPVLPMDDDEIEAWCLNAVALADEPCPPWRAARLCRSSRRCRQRPVGLRARQTRAGAARRIRGACRSTHGAARSQCVRSRPGPRRRAAGSARVGRPSPGGHGQPTHVPRRRKTSQRRSSEAAHPDAQCRSGQLSLPEVAALGPRRARAFAQTSKYGRRQLVTALAWSIPVHSASVLTTSTTGI